LGEYTDWRLPTIEELKDLYDPKRRGGYKIRKPFELTGWRVWSSTKQGSDSAWGFGFHDGERHYGPLAYPGGGRLALCVRRSGE
jgi:hypothetical protein